MSVSTKDPNATASYLRRSTRSRIPGPTAYTQKLQIPVDIFESSFIRQNFSKVRAAVDTVPLIPATSIVKWTKSSRFGPQEATAKWTQGNNDLQFTFAISGTGKEITDLVVEPKKPERITDAESRDHSEASQSPTNAYPWLSGSFKGEDWTTKFASSFGPGSAVPQDGSVKWWKHTKESLGQSEDIMKATWLLNTGEKVSRTMYERDKGGDLQQWDLKEE